MSLLGAFFMLVPAVLREQASIHEGSSRQLDGTAAASQQQQAHQNASAELHDVLTGSATSYFPDVKRGQAKKQEGTRVPLAFQPRSMSLHSMSSHIQQQCLPGTLQVQGCNSRPRRWHCAGHRSHPSSRHRCQCTAVAEGDDDAPDLASAFNKELVVRQTQQQAAQEQDVAREFDGQQLLKVLQSK